MSDISSMPVDIQEMLETCEKQYFWQGRIEFNDTGVRRLMAAKFLRAVRDVYAPDLKTRSDARVWLKENAVWFMHTHNLCLSHEKVCDWIRNGFPEEDVDLHFNFYFRNGGYDGEK